MSNQWIDDIINLNKNNKINLIILNFKLKIINLLNRHESKLDKISLFILKSYNNITFVTNIILLSDY